MKLFDRCFVFFSLLLLFLLLLSLFFLQLEPMLLNPEHLLAFEHSENFLLLIFEVRELFQLLDPFVILTVVEYGQEEVN